MASGTLDHSGRRAGALDGWRERVQRALRDGTYRILSDPSLVHRARHGERAAFDALAARHRGRLYNFALGSLADAAAASDALNEMLEAAYRDIDSVDAKRAPAAWLCMHGFRTVFRRKHVLPRRYTVQGLPSIQVGGNSRW